MSEETELLYPAPPYEQTLAGGQVVTVTRVDEELGYAVWDSACGCLRSCTVSVTAPITQEAIKAAIEGAI